MSKEPFTPQIGPNKGPEPLASPPSEPQIKEAPVRVQPPRETPPPPTTPPPKK